MFKYYVLVLVGRRGRWCAHFPDIPNCRAEDERLERAIEKATAAAARKIRELLRERLPVSEPRSFEEIRADTAWATKRSIEWPEVIVSIVGVPTDYGRTARLAS
jgi:predicted RNase H-like HicB family nuclease